jgi:hypothetical protein
LLGGWSPPLLAEIRGRTAADARLAADAYKDFVIVAGTHMGCTRIDLAEVVESRTSGAVADEIWIAAGCGKTAAFSVRFEPAPQGGYNYKIAQARQPSPSRQGHARGGATLAVITSVEKLNALRPGHTTAESVKTDFGEPESEDRNPDGRFVFLYPFSLPNKVDPNSPPLRGVVSFLFGGDSRLIRMRLYEDKGR